MDIEEKLQQLFRLQPLQNKVLVMRQECPEGYRKHLKQACMQDIKNLINVEIELEHTELKLPDPNKIPPICDQLQERIHLNKNKLDHIKQDQANTKQGLEFLDMV